MTYLKYKVAAVQAGPVYLNLEKTVEKVCNFIREASVKGAKIIGFPEAFLPGYPWWVWLGDSMKYTDYYARLLENSVSVGDGMLKKIAVCAKKNNIYVCIPGHERIGDSVFMTQFWFDDKGNLLGKHRKMKATAAERRVWQDGDGSTNLVYNTRLGKIGSLMCAEHHVPAYHALMGAQGEQVHVASYPPLPIELTGTMGLKAPLNAVRALCIENKAFAIFCTQVMNKDAIDMLCHDDKNLINKMPTTISGYDGCGGGAACVINPKGEIISGEFLKPYKEGIVYGNVDLYEAIEGKMLYDIYGNSQKGSCMHIVLDRKQEKCIEFLGNPVKNSISYKSIIESEI